MSVVTTEKSIFLHVPRTGGTWVNDNLLKNISPCCYFEDSGHVNFPRAHEYNNAKNSKTFFLFIRDPLTWYQSYFRRRMFYGWTQSPFDQDCGNVDTFNKFINKIIKSKHYHGYVSKMYRGFIDNYVDKGAGPIKIGRYENLVEDLVRILKENGEEFDEEEVRNFPPSGVQKVEQETIYTKENYSKMVELEKEAIEKYGYVT